MNTQAKATQAIRFRGRSFMAFVLEPTAPVADWLVEVEQWLARSPDFFVGRAVVLGVSDVIPTRKDLVDLIQILTKMHIRVMAIEGADKAWLGDDLPPAVAGGRPASIVEPLPQASPKSAAEARREPEMSCRSTLVIDQPVRSGQTIVAEGDVTVLGSVASGAEIVAGGSIHVYGVLRGRAVAGVQGNAKARVFARRFEAELIAIDGVYRTAEEMDPKIRGKAAQAWLGMAGIETAPLS